MSLAALSTPQLTTDRCVEFTIDANLGLLNHPKFQRFVEAGWLVTEIDVAEDRGREIVVRVTLSR